jgi:hypothetical protein
MEKSNRDTEIRTISLSNVLMDFEVEAQHFFIDMRFADAPVKAIRLILLETRKHMELEEMWPMCAGRRTGH